MVIIRFLVWVNILIVCCKWPSVILNNTDQSSVSRCSPKNLSNLGIIENNPKQLHLNAKHAETTYNIKMTPAFKLIIRIKS